MGNSIKIAALDGSGSFDVYCAEPEGSPKGAIIVIQEIFGVNAGIRAKVDGWAKEGYLAYAPDLFWRERPGVELDADVPEQFDEAIGYMQRFSRDLAIADIEATIRTARAQSGGKVGAVGFCMGGLLAYLTATRTDIDASVGYYGVSIDSLLGEAHGIANPLLLHFAEKDHFVSPEAVETIKQGLGSNSRVSIHVYPGVDHGFAAEFGQRRVEDAKQLADGRTKGFFAEHIG